MSVQKGVDILKKEKRRNNLIITKILQDPDQIKNRKEKKRKEKERKEGKEINPPMISTNDECAKGVDISKKEKRRNNYNKNSVSSPNEKSKRKEKERKKEKGKETNSAK